MAQEKSSKHQITSSSAAEYFAKNIQQVGFSSPVKAVLTTIKEAMDNSLDACEDAGILPEISIKVEKIGKGHKNTDLLSITVSDNGPGIPLDKIAQVFGEYLASSKFGRGRCTRGQQGIGISAATTYAMQTTAKGVRVISKTSSMKKAVSATVEVDIKNNKGLIKDKQEIEWTKKHGVEVTFNLEGRVQLNGEAGLLTFFRGNALMNPHLTLDYDILGEAKERLERVSSECPEVPDAVSPHPHTMKLGEFMSHAKTNSGETIKKWLKTGFSRMSDSAIAEAEKKLAADAKILGKKTHDLTEAEMKTLFSAVSDLELPPPMTNTVLAISEESLEKSVRRLGGISFFAVVARKPAICDFKPVKVDVAIAKLSETPYAADSDEGAVEILRFANRVPLQFDKAACAIVKAIGSINWKSYGMQHKGGIPVGPFVIAVSVVSPFLKFKNASKETLDASDELVEEIRRAIMQAGQKLSKHLAAEQKKEALEEKRRHIEQFAPILITSLGHIIDANAARKKQAEQGLLKILGRDAEEAEKAAAAAQTMAGTISGGAQEKVAEGDEKKPANTKSKKTK